MGLGKTSIALFDLGKKCLREKGGGNEKFGKYIALLRFKEFKKSCHPITHIRISYLLTCLLVELNQKSHNRIGTYRYSYDDDIPESFIHRLYFLLLRDLQ